MPPCRSTAKPMPTLPIFCGGCGWGSAVQRTPILCGRPGEILWVSSVLSPTNPSDPPSTHRVEIDGIMATKLCTHVHEADRINSDSLARLAGEVRVFAAKDSVADGSWERRWEKCGSLLSCLLLFLGDEIGAGLLSRCCRAPQALQLKIGAQVRFRNHFLYPSTSDPLPPR